MRIQIETESLSTGSGVSLRNKLITLWQSRSIWAIADQGVLSLGNFLCSMLLARRLPDVEFGIYAFVLTILLQLNNLHGALVGYALTVRGATMDDAHLRRLTAVSIIMTLGLGLIGTGAMSAGLILFGHPSVIPFAVFALMGWQLQETVRRGMLARFRYRGAMLGDGISYIGQVIPMWYLAQKGELTVFNALLINGLASFVAMGLQVFQVRLRRFSYQDFINGCVQSWELGKWLLASNAIAVFVIPIIPWTLAFFHTERDVAGYQAMATILGISHPVLFSVCNIIVPATAKANATGGIRSARSTGLRYAIHAALILGPYYVGLMILPDLALRLFYGAESPYLGLGTPLRLIALYYLLLFISMVVLGLLNGLENTSSNFYSQLTSALATVAIGVPLVMVWGLEGACWARVLQVGVAVIVVLWLWAKLWNTRTSASSIGRVGEVSAC
ncbi:MAG: hypothetical protein KatS3mg104_1335 [Phycisphaerae bacterium]|nr:MAG: hypothetical protein KatS3mg104_1335 [Phycisphaerae bacterium]